MNENPLKDTEHIERDYETSIRMLLSDFPFDVDGIDAFYINGVSVGSRSDKDE